MAPTQGTKDTPTFGDAVVLHRLPTQIERN